MRPRRDWRVARRLGGVALHLCVGAVLVAIVFPRAGLERRRRLRQRWSQGLLRALGVDLDQVGTPAPGLIAANHVSWLDIFVINAVVPCAFVCKDEVAAWPLIGWLCRHNETIFLTRGKARSARATAAEMAQRIAAGDVVAVFPEGTTSDGSGVLPMAGALLQAAIDADVAVIPVVIAYRDEFGSPSSAPVYVGETSLLESICSIAARPRTIARCAALAPIPATGMARQELRGGVEAALQHGLQRSHASVVTPAARLRREPQRAVIAGTG